MDLEQDYLMRMIKQMVKAWISAILGKENPIYELPAEELYQSSEELFRELLDMVNDGKINEAENLLYERIDYTNKDDICDAISFYSYLNELDDDFLAENNYSREEIELGLKRIASMVGMDGLADVFE